MKSRDKKNSEVFIILQEEIEILKYDVCMKILLELIESDHFISQSSNYRKMHELVTRL